MTDSAQKAVSSLAEIQQKYGANFQAFIAKRPELGQRISELEAAVAKLPHDAKNGGFLATSVFDEYTPRCDSKVGEKDVILPFTKLACNSWNLLVNYSPHRAPDAEVRSVEA